MPLPQIGERVEIAPHFDLWMRGARFGVVRKHHKPKYQARNGAALLTPIISVEMDKLPGKLFRFFATDVTTLA